MKKQHKSINWIIRKTKKKETKFINLLKVRDGEKNVTKLTFHPFSHLCLLCKQKKPLN